MPVIAVPAAIGPRLKRGGAVAILAVGLAGALSLATLSTPRFAHAVGQGLSESLESVKTVAAMLAERSPGQRPEGALAQLKHKRSAALHERALPKVRRPAPTAYEALAGPAPSLPLAATPPQAPLYTNVAGGPTPIIPLTGGAFGGPPILSDIPSPGGGGGGFTPPPITTQEVPPVTPATPVPEPATWTMMILGFALIGRALSRKNAARLAPALE